MPIFCKTDDCARCKSNGECRRITSEISKAILGTRAGRFDARSVHDRDVPETTDAVQIIHDRYDPVSTDLSSECPRSSRPNNLGGSCRFKQGTLCFPPCVCLPLQGGDNCYHSTKPRWTSDTGAQDSV